MYFLDFIDREIAFQNHMLKQYNRLKRLKTDGKLEMTRKRKGYVEYYIRDSKDNIRHFVRRKDMNRVTKIQVQMTGAEGAARAENNIRLLSTLKEEYKACDFFSVQASMEEKYRLIADADTPWAEKSLRKIFPQSENMLFRNELIHSTSFGLMVRSKNEAQIAEMLWAAGLEFYYEKRVRLEMYAGHHRTFYPDFTIKIAGSRTIYWEHKGMIDDVAYLRRDEERTRIYHRNGIYQPHNLVVTCDGPSGEFPGIEIAMIVAQLAAAEKKL